MSALTPTRVPRLTQCSRALPKRWAMRALALAVVIAVLSAPGVAHGQLRSVDLAFRLPADARVVGFHVYLAGSRSAYTDYRDDINYLPALDANGLAHYALAGLEPYAETYVSLKSYDGSGAESVFSNEVVFAPDPVCSPGSTCDDGNPMTFGDVCQSNGACAGTPGECNVNADCPAPSDLCAGPSSCVAHLCRAGSSPKPDETPCNDGRAGTRYDVCRAGVCRGFACGFDAQCSDGDACDGTERCVANACSAGAPMVCDDGNACNGVETCQSSACAAGAPPACPTDSGPCFAARCDASTGCAVQTYPDGTACTTSLSGSPGTCSAGVCQAATTSPGKGRRKRR